MRPGAFKERVDKLRKEVFNSKTSNVNIANDIISVTKQFFEQGPIQWYYNFSSVEIWKDIHEMLAVLNLTAEEIVDQETIDTFYVKLLQLMEVEMFESLVSQVEAPVTSEVMREYMEARGKISDTIIMIKNHMSKMNYQTLIQHKENYVVYLANTPIGLAEVKFCMAEDEVVVKLLIEGNPKAKPAIIDITAELNEYFKTA